MFSQTIKVINLTTSRRTFIVQSIITGVSLASANLADAQSALVKETDARAVTLNYKADGTKVDKTKFPKYAAGQNCSTCVLYQGKPADAAGICPLFAGNQVSAKAWCSTWAKKA
jgi:High potential iron-sulfur protein